MAIRALLLPTVCATCRARGRTPLCIACEQEVSWIHPPACGRCGAPTTNKGCLECTGRDFSFTGARAAALYEGPARDALIQFKVLGDRRSGAALARPMTALARKLNADAVTFVPGTRRSDASRGFNPAAVLARPIARSLRLPLKKLVEKRRETPDASGLGRTERLLLLKDAFVPARQARAAVILVDDILTTGATADACSRALRQAGATAVWVVVFARAARILSPGISSGSVVEEETPSRCQRQAKRPT